MKRTPISVVCVVLLSAMLVCLAGCATKSKSQEAAGIMMSDQVTFSDLPVPQNFKLLRDQSYAYKDGQARIALLRYKGKGKIDDVSWFYQENMADCQWQDVNMIDYEKNVQQFVKAGESALVTIEKVNEPWFLIIPCHKIVITIQVMPNQNEMKNAAAVQSAPVSVVEPVAYEEPASATTTYEAPSKTMSLPVLK